MGRTHDHVMTTEQDGALTPGKEATMTDGTHAQKDELQHGISIHATEGGAGGFTIDEQGRCRGAASHCHELLELIRQSSETWVHIDGHGDAYSATEDRHKGYSLPACDPCYGAVGRYSAVWFCPERRQCRCSGCLHWYLTHPESHTSASERPGA